MKTNILFICMSALDRSPCASEIVNKDYSDKFEAKFAGVSPLAEIEVNQKLIDWANKIICMERENRDALFFQLPKAREKSVEVWNISNNYCRYDKELEKELREKIEGLYYE